MEGVTHWVWPGGAVPGVVAPAGVRVLWASRETGGDRGQLQGVAQVTGQLQGVAQGTDPLWQQSSSIFCHVRYPSPVRLGSPLSPVQVLPGLLIACSGAVSSPQRSLCLSCRSRCSHIYWEASPLLVWIIYTLKQLPAPLAIPSRALSPLAARCCLWL